MPVDDLPKPDVDGLLPQPFDQMEFEGHMPYMGFQPGSLNPQKEKFVHLYVSGMTAPAAAVAVGAKSTMGQLWLREDETVKKAVEYFREKNREKLDFTIETAHTMLMEAWTNSKDATEQVAVVRELVKLHGVAAAPKPQEVNININNRKQVERASDEKLLELAGVDPNYLRPVPKIRKQEPIVDAEFTEIKEPESTE